MHELALCQAIAETVVARADGRAVSRVAVRIGHLRQVVPDSLQFSWQLLVEGSELDGCELAVDHVPAVVHCAQCAADTKLDMPVLACATCGSFDVEVLSGEELLVAAIDIAQEVP